MRSLTTVSPEQIGLGDELKHREVTPPAPDGVTGGRAVHRQRGEVVTGGRSGRARAHPGATAGQVMSSPVITVAPGDSVGQVAATLRRGAVSAAPVVEGTGVVLGLVSTHEVAARRGRTAYDLMTTAVISVSEDTPVADVRHLLVDRRIGRVLVLTGGRLVGILSLGDMAWLRATEWVCATCGEPVHGDRAPARCPRCGAGSHRFAPQQQPPGS